MFLASLEEDHVVSSDFYRMVQALTQTLMRMPRDTVFSASAGSIDQHARYVVASRSDLFAVQLHNVQNAGLAFSAYYFDVLWNSAVEHWCSFNEYNWDWALYRMSQQLVPGANLVPALSRVSHAGGCGMHTSHATCDALYNEVMANQIEPLNALAQSYLWMDSDGNSTGTLPSTSTTDKNPRTGKPLKLDQPTQWRPGITPSRARPLHEGFEGWLNGRLDSQHYQTLLAQGVVHGGTPGRWESPFHRLLCERVTKEPPL